jgi:hypothetical protein
MAILHNPESPYVKEMAKWEQFPSEYTLGGLKPGNPYTFRPYPKMLYMARQTRSGKWAVSDELPSRFGFPDDQSWDRACQEVAKFNESCYRVVNDEAEDKRAHEEGWRDNPKMAMEWRESLEKAIGDAAAERNFRDRNMGEKAKAEAAKAEAEHFGHLAEIPEKPRRRKAS